MKVVILAGGFGTRISEYTDLIPKPMIKIGDKPILWHIMKTYAHYGYKDFYLALGYKSQLIKEYFLNYKALNDDFSINLKTGHLKTFKNSDLDWNITMIDTGLNSMTGGRIKRMESFLKDEPFLLTYGDGVADIDLNKLVDFHKKEKKMVTVTAVHPGARFGELSLEGNSVTEFQEKPQISEGWINGGFFVIEPEFLSFIDSDSTILEKSPLERVAEMGQLKAYKHEGFWQCMDTKRDKDTLDNLWNSSNAPWKKW